MHTVIFHHNDADGRCAAAIAAMGERSIGNTAGTVFIEMDYAKPVPLDVVSEDDRVIIVDFSFKPADMEQLQAKTDDIVWIDHHATAAKYPYHDIGGMRNFADKGECGAELTWRYYFGIPSRKYAMPEAVTLLGDYDSWRMKLRPKSLEFYEGLKLRNQDPVSPLWIRLTADFLGGVEGQEAGILVDEICEAGRTAILYRDLYCAELRKSFGFECTLLNADGLKCYALNAYRFGSQAYGDLGKEYDVLIAFITDGDSTTVSLYTEKDIDVSQIARSLGGGGHKQAAGFVVPSGKELPFKKI